MGLNSIASVRSQASSMDADSLNRSELDNLSVDIPSETPNNSKLHYVTSSKPAKGRNIVKTVTKPSDKTNKISAQRYLRKVYASDLMRVRNVEIERMADAQKLNLNHFLEDLERYEYRQLKGIQREYLQRLQMIKSRGELRSKTTSLQTLIISQRFEVKRLQHFISEEELVYKQLRSYLDFLISIAQDVSTLEIQEPASESLDSDTSSSLSSMSEVRSLKQGKLEQFMKHYFSTPRVIVNFLEKLAEANLKSVEEIVDVQEHNRGYEQRERMLQRPRLEFPVIRKSPLSPREPHSPRSPRSPSEKVFNHTPKEIKRTLTTMFHDYVDKEILLDTKGKLAALEMLVQEYMTKLQAYSPERLQEGAKFINIKLQATQVSHRTRQRMLARQHELQVIIEKAKQPLPRRDLRKVMQRSRN